MMWNRMGYFGLTSNEGNFERSTKDSRLEYMKLSTDPNPSAVEVRVPLIALWRLGGVTPQASGRPNIIPLNMFVSRTRKGTIRYTKKVWSGGGSTISMSNPSLFDIVIGNDFILNS